MSLPYWTHDPDAVATFWYYTKVATDCWLWQGPLTNGYGEFRIRRDGKRYGLRAHVFSLALHYPEEFTPYLFTCHECDNPPCVNPNHLWQGTVKDNQADMARKQRSCLGEKHWRSTLTSEQVLEMRQQYAAGVPTAYIARTFGISISHVADVVRGRSWRHLGEALPDLTNTNHAKGERNNKAKLTAEQVIEIRKRFDAGGLTYSALAREYEITPVAMRRLVLRVTWRHLP